MPGRAFHAPAAKRRGLVFSFRLAPDDVAGGLRLVAARAPSLRVPRSMPCNAQLPAASTPLAFSFGVRDGFQPPSPKPSAPRGRPCLPSSRHGRPSLFEAREYLGDLPVEREPVLAHAHSLQFVTRALSAKTSGAASLRAVVAPVVSVRHDHRSEQCAESGIRETIR